MLFLSTVTTASWPILDQTRLVRSLTLESLALSFIELCSTGEVQLFDAFNLHSKLTIPAHDSTLAAITFNPAGTRLATASEKGTVIRVFSVEDGEKLIEFRYATKSVRNVASGLTFTLHLLDEE